MAAFHFAPRAIADVEEISAYIARDNPAAVVRLVDKLVLTCERLAHFPLTGRPRSDLLEGLRSAPVGNYVVFYDLVPDGIEVVRVLHGARDIDAIFREWP